MADEPQVPAQPEGAGQPTKKKPAPVNLAMIEAAERGLVLDPVPPPKTPAKAAPPVEAPASKGPSAEATASKAPTESAPPAAAAPELPTATEDEAGTGEASPETQEEVQAREEGGESSATLAELADAASRKRLSPRDEDRATALLRGCINHGEAAEALAAMPKLPWILGVRAIEQAWPQLTPEHRTGLLEQLAAFQSEHAIRLRLSVARSLAKIDPPVGVELAGSVCRAMWDYEKGGLSTDHSKLIGNVFIGRGKPWVIQLPLESLPPADAQAIVSAVLFSAFNVNNPPITQLSILRYAAPHLAELHPNLLAMIGKGVGRWSGKWQDSLRKEVPNLPEVISTSLKPGRPGRPEGKPAGEESGGASVERSADESEDEEVALPPALEEKLKLAVESGDAEAVAAVTLEVNAWRDSQATAKAEAPESRPPREDAAEDSERRGDKKRRGRERDRDRNDRPQERRDRPVYISREQEAASKGAAPFNLGAVLKQIENQFALLKSELGATQAKLRKAEVAPKRPADRIVLSVEEANLSPDELKRLVLQLERRNGELQARVEELLGDSETRALATAADSDVTAQFRTLLKLKIQEDYSDYLALEKNSPEYVVQQHYRALIRHVFGVLRDEGIGLEGDLPPPPPEPLPPPPPPPVIEDEADEEESALDELDSEPDAESAEVEPMDDAAADEAGEDAPELPSAAEDQPEEAPDEAPEASDETEPRPPEAPESPR